jgi:hypothetical protein
MSGKPVIRYTWNVKKCIEFASSWLDHYGVSKKDIDSVFAGTSVFVKKYSKKPPAKMISADVESACAKDAKEFYEKIEKRVRELDPPLTEKRIQKVLDELPDKDDLLDLMMSYRIHDTEDRTRVRKATKASMTEYDFNLF